MSKHWPAERIERFRELAASGEYASAIAAKLGVTHMGLLVVASKRGIIVKRYTPAEQAEIDGRAKARQRRKDEKWKAKQAEKKPRRAIMIDATTSRTHPAYRNQLPRLPEMSKSELRDMLSQAVRNTAEMPA